MYKLIKKLKAYKKPYLMRAARFSPIGLLVFIAIFGLLGSDKNSQKSDAVISMPSAPISKMALNSGQQNYLGDTSKYKYVILQDYMHASVAAIKAANPNTKVLAYKNMAASINDCTQPSSTGVTYCEARDSNPGWFLHNASGQPFTFCDFNYLYWMDIGSATYRQKWVDNVISGLKARGFDGVFMDDTNTHPGHCMDGALPKYTDVQYGQAMAGFVAKVGSDFKAAGLLTVANVSSNPWISSQESIALQMAPNVTAFFREHFMHWNSTASGLFTDAIWDSVMKQHDDVSKVGNYLANTYSGASDVRAMRYGRASFLLGWNGSSSSAYQYHVDAQADSYNTEWAADIGTPTTSRFQTSGAWRRNFTGGTALVNPSSTATITVSLGGSYINSSGATVTSVTLGPASGQILKSTTVSPSPPPTSPPPSSSDTTAPTVAITGVSNGATISGSSAAIGANASDNVGVSKVEFYLDGAWYRTEVNPPYCLAEANSACIGWDSTTISSGTHSIYAKAYDAANNSTTSTTINFTVSNTTTTPPPPPTTSSPTADFNFSPTSPVVGQTVTYTSTGTCPATPCTYAYANDTGGGNFVTFATTSTATFTYQGTGTKTVRLSVTDSQNRTDAVTKTVTVGSASTPPPSPPPTTKTGDLNGDTKIDIFDLSILLSNYSTSNANADINNDNIVNIFDLSILLSNYGK